MKNKKVMDIVVAISLTHVLFCFGLLEVTGSYVCLLRSNAHLLSTGLLPNVSLHLSLSFVYGAILLATSTCSFRLQSELILYRNGSRRIHPSHMNPGRLVLLLEQSNIGKLRNWSSCNCSTWN